MIGNDIVDLYLAGQESRIHRKGFLVKLFLPGEKALIRHAADPAVMVWLLWSCKEAAYKIVHRATRERKYAPQQFACEVQRLDNRHAAGIVTHQQQTYYFQSNRTGSCIHTYAAVNPQLLQQVAVFTTAVPSLTDLLLSPGELLYKDEDGIPYIRERYNAAPAPVSLSHHGKYSGAVRI